MRSCTKFAAACILGVLGSIPHGAAIAADLVILTNIMVGVPGTDDVGPLPGFLNKPCPTSVGLLTNSKEPEAAPLLRKTYVEPFHP